MSSLAMWCPPPCPPPQQHGTACGVAAVEELSVVCAGRPQSSPGGGPHPTVPLSAKVSVWGALCTLVGGGGGEVCGGISCSSAQQHGLRVVWLQ